MGKIVEILKNFYKQSGINAIFSDGGWQSLVMIAVACFLLFLGIKKKFEPLLLVGIAFGMLLSNIPSLNDKVYHPNLWNDPTGVNYGLVLTTGGLVDILYIGVKTGVYPCLIFIGVGAMTDFGPMLANPKSLILGAAAQLGIFIALLLAILIGFTGDLAAAVAIIGGADGPTAIFLAKTLAPEYLGPIAIAAYSYMALIPMIQPPLMKLLTTEKERKIRMEAPRQVTKTEKIVFPILVTIVTAILLPSVTALLGCLMFGNLLRECKVTERLVDVSQNALMNIVTLLLGISVGATAQASMFLKPATIAIIVLGLVAFMCATTGGLLFGKLLCKLTKGKINPLIGSAGVSAVPMAARVSEIEGRKYDPDNHLLMHAMGPNVAGVIGSAVAAGFLLAVFG